LLIPQSGQKAEEKKVYPGSCHEEQNLIIVSQPASSAPVSHYFKPGPAPVKRVKSIQARHGDEVLPIAAKGKT
jgi:hypothetical protein